MTGYKRVAKFALLWNACLALFFFCINALPYIVSGQWEAFVAGISMLAQDVSWNDNLPQIAYRTMQAIQTQDMLSNLLFFAGGLFAFILIGMVIVLRLEKTMPGPRPVGLLSGVVLFELGLLIVIVPLSIEMMILSKRFWLHYAQLFAPFAAIATVAFGVLIHQARPWLLAEPAKRMVLLLAFAIALPLAFGSASQLQTQPQHLQPDRTPQTLSALLDELGQQGDFLAPYNIYVHWKLQQHRYGFPHVVHTMRITGTTPWGTEEWQDMQIPARFHLPTTLQEYCQMLDTQGPRLIVFFAHSNAEADNYNPLLECQLQQYDFHDVSSGSQLHDVTHYFLRQQ